jgi:hypothetical protein
MKKRMPLNLEEFSLSDAEARAPGQPPQKRRPTPVHEERFLRGPISWPWLVRAARLPGRALHVALVLQQQKGWRGCDSFTFTLTRVRELGLDEQAARRGLRELEAARLIALARKPGRGLLVTILPATAQNGAAS